jgi:hypothetical protein
LPILDILFSSIWMSRPSSIVPDCRSETSLISIDCCYEEMDINIIEKVADLAKKMQINN